MNNVVEVVVYGNHACFTMPEAKIDRVSYAVPTPSACRGILCAIYCKPDEFWYEVIGIDVLKPIKYLSVKKNEVGKKASMKGDETEKINVDKERTQRNSVYLKDVAYKITARIMIRDTFQPETPLQDKIKKIRGEFEKRVRRGKCFWQPYLGTRECMCFFREPNADDVPITDSADFGIMLYDVFDPSNNVPLNTDKKATKTCVPNPMFFDAKMRNGHIDIPRYESEAILKTKENEKRKETEQDVSVSV